MTPYQPAPHAPATSGDWTTEAAALPTQPHRWGQVTADLHRTADVLDAFARAEADPATAQTLRADADATRRLARAMTAEYADAIQATQATQATQTTTPADTGSPATTSPGSPGSTSAVPDPPFRRSFTMTDNHDANSAVDGGEDTTGAAGHDSRGPDSLGPDSLGPDVAPTPDRAQAPGQDAYCCPECGEAVHQTAPAALAPAGTDLGCWSHLDGEPLCPVMGPDGYQPAEPVTVQEHATQWGLDPTGGETGSTSATGSTGATDPGREAMRQALLDGRASVADSVAAYPEWAPLAELAGLDPTDTTRVPIPDLDDDPDLDDQGDLDVCRGSDGQRGLDEGRKSGTGLAGPGARAAALDHAWWDEHPGHDTHADTHEATSDTAPGAASEMAYGADHDDGIEWSR